MTTGTLHQRFLDRLFPVFRKSPNELYQAETFTGPMDETYEAMAYYLAHTDLDDREGVLLDWTGWLIGVRRPPAQEPDENLFWLCPLDAVDIEPETRGFSTLDQTEGGYMTGLAGIVSVSDPGSFMGDDDYRELIKTKAATFRKSATRDVLYEYLEKFGIRVLFEFGTAEITYNPQSFDDTPYWKRDYVVNKGFSPAGIKIIFPDQTEPEEGL